jgi:hypothetical protein
MFWRSQAKVAELVDAHDSKSCIFGCEGSIPSFGTKISYKAASCLLGNSFFIHSFFKTYSVRHKN